MRSVDRAIHLIRTQTALSGYTQHWMAESSDSDGVTHKFAFPLDMVETRAAEYGFDHSDEEQMYTVADVIMHELFIPDPINPDNFFSDAAMAAGITTRCHFSYGPVEKGDKVPVHLYNAESPEQARAALLARVAAVKETTAWVRSSVHFDRSKLRGLSAERGAQEDHLNILVRHPVSPEAYQEKMNRAFEMRDSFLNSDPTQQAPAAPLSRSTAGRQAQKLALRAQSPFDQSIAVRMREMRLAAQTLGQQARP